jgi:nitroimidazol reductase NimA-like FMN-containing flavoprotein (pyridoxamine 5'-phosphate oxidase superfamily)
MDLLDRIKEAQTPCAWTSAYRSVVGVGRASLVEGREEKRQGLGCIMAHYGAQGPFDYPDEIVDQTAVIRIDIASLTGKRHD